MYNFRVFDQELPVKLEAARSISRLVKNEQGDVVVLMVCLWCVCGVLVVLARELKHIGVHGSGNRILLVMFAVAKLKILHLC